MPSCFLLDEICAPGRWRRASAATSSPAGADDDGDLVERRRRRPAQAEHGPPRDLVEDLGAARFHARAFAGGQHNGEGAAVFGACCILLRGLCRLAGSGGGAVVPRRFLSFIFVLANSRAGGQAPPPQRRLGARYPPSNQKRKIRVPKIVLSGISDRQVRRFFPLARQSRVPVPHVRTRETLFESHL